MTAFPHVSVIIPVYQHWQHIPALLARLAAQTLPTGEMEILIVDNGSPMERPDLALPGNARVLTCSAPGSYAARNLGAAAARGRLLAFTDADCLPDFGWLAAMVAAADRLPQCLLAGPVRIVTSDSANSYEIYDCIRGIPQERYVRLGYAASANLVVPRPVFDAVSGFDTGRFSGGDADFCRRAGSAGHEIALVPEAVVDHPARNSWQALAVKARRVKGGQITGGPRRLRVQWFLRTLTPPLRASVRFVRAPRPWHDRVIAISVLYRLWLVELAEVARLLAGRLPERR
ncbi:MAG: glycosyltransferase family 2 protein [Qingshengfaniella sp.]